MKTPTEQIKEIEKEIDSYKTYIGKGFIIHMGKEKLFIIAEEKLKVLKEWEARENYILEIIDARILACKQNQKRGLKPDNYNEFGDYNEFANRLEELKNKIKGEGK